MKDESTLITFLGDTPVIRVLDFLLTERDLDFFLTEMAEQSGIGRTTLYRIWDILLRSAIVVPTRIIGKAKLYKLNANHPAIRKLIELDDILIKQELRTRAGKMKIAVPA